MDYQKGLIILLQLILTNLLCLTKADEARLFHFCIDESGNYTQNSSYHKNLNTLLSAVSSNISEYGFYSGSVGETDDKVNAIVMCGGQVQIGTCRSCITNAKLELVKICPSQKEAIIYYDKCMLRYSNNPINGTVTTDNTFIYGSGNNLTRVDEFNREVRTFLDSIRSLAANGGPFRKFATGKITLSDNETIYALEQCTPDLSADQCTYCLDHAADRIPKCCTGSRGLRIMGPSCVLHYENFKFLSDDILDAGQPPSGEGIHKPTSEAGQPPLGKSPSGGNDSKSTMIIILSVSVLGVLMIIVCICLIIMKQKKRKQKKASIDQVDGISSVESLQYDISTISAATNDFAEANKLGHGGFGVVYKGELSNGQEIAVKRLSSGSSQGDLEFKNEVLLVAKLQHRNLVRLLGFCLEGSERILIYEYMPNASLDHLIYDPIKRENLDWDRRYNIIGGVAKGLLYLHEDSRLRIIHRDLKASNVLLDEHMNPKISDFGMARLFVLDETQGNTNRVVGTYGYMPPEYVLHGQFSAKSDVFSFGVLALEIVCGKKHNYSRDREHGESLQSYVWKNWEGGTTENVIDPILRARSGSTRDILRCIHIGLLCVQENATDRPTMASVILMLSSFSVNLPLPSEPAFLLHGSLESETSRSDEENELRVLDSTILSGSVNKDSITDLYPR